MAPARRFLRDRRGVAALEFALVAPLLLILYMGASDVALGVTLNRKLQNIATTTADLVGQTKGSTISRSEVAAILQISGAMIEPYDPDDIRMQLLSVTIDGNGKTKVDWAVKSGAVTAYSKGAAYPLPDALSLHRNRSFVIAEVGFDYKPMGSFGFDNVIEMKEESYQTARNTVTGALNCVGC